MPCCGVHLLVYLRQGITVFWACLIQVRKINAHLLGPIGLFNEHHIRNLLRILTLPNEPSLQQLLRLYGHCRGPLGAYVSFSLNRWLVNGICIQSMLHSHRVNVGHFLGTEGKNVPVLL